MSPKYLLSVDPARFAGWAFFIGGKLKFYGEADGSQWHTFKDAMSGLTLYSNDIAAHPVAEAVCVIEQGWSNGSKSAMTLAQRRGIAQAAAEAYGFRKFIFQHSSTWQNQLYGPLAGRNTKELAIDYAIKTWQVSNISHDVADAIAIGSHYLGARHGEGQGRPST
jgi:hypothetical protein